MNILLVDDTRTDRRIMSTYLSKMGHQVTLGENGLQAVELFKSIQPDLLLMDVIMPEMDGYQLAKIVKEKYPGVKIQLVSGYSDGRHVSMKDSVLSENLIHKPYRAEVLLKRIRELLS